MIDVGRPSHLSSGERGGGLEVLQGLVIGVHGERGAGLQEGVPLSDSLNDGEELLVPNAVVSLSLGGATGKEGNREELC